MSPTSWTDCRSRRLFGVGPKTAAGGARRGDLAASAICAAPAMRCCGGFSASTAGHARPRLRHRDRPVEPNREEKSISAEETFAADIREAAAAHGAIAAPRRSNGLAAARAASDRGNREREDPARRFHYFYPAALLGDCHPGHRCGVGRRQGLARGMAGRAARCCGAPVGSRSERTADAAPSGSFRGCPAARCAIGHGD